MPLDQWFCAWTIHKLLVRSIIKNYTIYALPKEIKLEIYTIVNHCLTTELKDKSLKW